MKINILEAIESLNKGKLVAITTDTVFGLFTKNSNLEIYKLKNRDLNKKLCIYSNNLPFNTKNYDLLGRTFIYNHMGYRAGTVCPTLSYILKFTGDLYGTSANFSGHIPITYWQHVPFDIEVVPGRCFLGLESTIINLDNNSIIRDGYFAHKKNIEGHINKYIGPRIIIDSNEKNIKWNKNNKINAYNFWYILNEYKNNNKTLFCEYFHENDYLGKILNIYLKNIYTINI
jgi:tRNA A37 threonylcarbamoyladenosine synthetase subunit TsaC/SUA5/YrdC